MAHDTQLVVMQADITTLEVDAIVNAANNSLLGGGGVDGAIHRAAGPELLEFTRKLGGCKTGQAKLSPAFNLPARAVIHTVGPIWSGGEHNEAVELRNAYGGALKIAADEGFTSIAFPAISCGVYGYPLQQAAEVAVATVREMLPTMPRMEQIIFCCFDNKMAQIYNALLKD